jgi:DNA-binding response OmpR family regulator
LLVIDDEPHIWRLLDINLAAGGFAVHAAPTLAAARAELATGRTYAAVLLDLALPDGSGLELLREWAGHPPAPVLVLTGEIEERVLDEVRALGAQVLAKPFSPSKLAARVAMLAAKPTREGA